MTEQKKCMDADMSAILLRTCVKVDSLIILLRTLCLGCCYKKTIIKGEIILSFPLRMVSYGMKHLLLPLP